MSQVSWCGHGGQDTTTQQRAETNLAGGAPRCRASQRAKSCLAHPCPLCWVDSVTMREAWGFVDERALDGPGRVALGVADGANASSYHDAIERRETARIGPDALIRAQRIISRPRR